MLRKQGKLQQAAQGRPLVVYVEDEPLNADVARAKLERDYELVVATTDQEACAVLRREPRIHAILMDIQLKGSVLNGMDLALLVRGHSPRQELPSYARDLPVARLKDTPLFFLTAYGSGLKPEELAHIGANGIVAKPVDFVRLSSAIVKATMRAIAT